MLKHRSETKKAYIPLRTICGSFVAVILVGTLLLLLPWSTRSGISPVEALFTATSATCVTGLVVRDTYQAFTNVGQFLILCMIQIGGLGLMTLTSFFTISLGRKTGLRNLRLASESVSASDLVETRRLLFFIFRFVFLTEAVGALLLSPVFVRQFDVKHGIWLSIFMSISAFCNAGFDIFGFLGPYSSVTSYVSNGYVQGVLALLIISGGLGFVVWQDIFFYHKTRHVTLQTRVVLLFSLILSLGGGLLFAILEWNNPATLAPLSFGEKLFNSLFQSISCRTAGMNTLDLAACGSFSKMLMCLLMFVGAAPGGTGGGVKVTTFAVLIVTVISACTGAEDATIFKRRIDKKVIYRSLAIISLSLIVLVVGMCALWVGTPPEMYPLDALFEAASAYGTVGLSVGVTALTNLPARLVTICIMFIGRVGPITLALSLASHPMRTRCREILPEGKISVG